MSRKKTFYWLVAWWTVGFVPLVLALEFSEITESVGLGPSRGTLGALADFNGDRLTDILVLNKTGNLHSLFLWDREVKSFQQSQITLDVPLPIVRVGVADFDGDGVVDIVTFSNTTDPEGCCLATVHWCQLQDNSITTIGNSTLKDERLAGYPLILDYNGDHLADIASVTREGKYTAWISGGQRRAFQKKVLLSGSEFEVHSSYFIDMDSDCISELMLFVTRKDGSLKGFLVLSKDSNSPTFAPLPPPLRAHPVLGIPVFADMDGDGRLEAVVFSRYDKNCHHTAVHVLLTKKFSGSDVLKCQRDPAWSLEFKSLSTVNLTSMRPAQIEQLRPAVIDINLDGFPDILVPAVNNRSESHPLLLLGGGYDNKLLPQPHMFSEARFANTTQAVYFDLGENGIPDLLLVQGGGVGGETRVTAHKHRLDQDHAFLKVLVLSGHCFSSICPGEHYSSSLPGAAVSFSTTDRNGNKEVGVAVIRGTGDSPLQLPFVLFGLGETPNFIQSLTIGAGYTLPPGNGSSWRVSSREWSLLVPNSQVIVLTQQADDAKSWKVELYLTPSDLVYSTAGVLGATAVVIAIIIALLQAREKYQDSKERKQAKHKFHFNAM